LGRAQEQDEADDVVDLAQALHELHAHHQLAVLGREVLVRRRGSDQTRSDAHHAGAVGREFRGE
jgi:hypothetical protein